MADPTPTTQGQASAQDLAVPEDLQKKYPELIGLVKGSESMNNEERQYWINILPIMTPEQVKNLFDILDNERKQLAAIDAKYQNEMQKLGNTQDAKILEEERRKRRTERTSSEQAEAAKEGAEAEDILKQIEEAGHAK